MVGHGQYSSGDAGSKIGDTAGCAPYNRWRFTGVTEDTEDTEDMEPEDEAWLKVQDDVGVG